MPTIVSGWSEATRSWLIVRRWARFQKYKIIMKLTIKHKARYVYILTYIYINFEFFRFYLLTGSISNIDDAEYHCNKTQVRKVISGVVGAASSVTSIQVANLLRLFRIPQVGRCTCRIHNFWLRSCLPFSFIINFLQRCLALPSAIWQWKVFVLVIKKCTTFVAWCWTGN